MSAEDTHNAGDELQFDRVVGDAPAAAREAGSHAVVCTVCSQPITSDYFQLNGKVACERCRNAVEVAVATPEGVQPAVRAAGLGILAAIAGAGVYYGVLKLAHLNLSLITIGIGYIVGWAVTKGAGGGGRRFQILAVLLTYWAIGLAYASFYLQDSTMPPVSQFFYVLTIPILVITRGMSGILSAIIFAIGLRQAWQMTAAPSLKIEGPYRVGSGPSAASA